MIGDWYLGSGFGIGMGDWDLGLGIRIWEGLRIWIQDWALRLGIGIGDWGSGIGIRDRDWGLVVTFVCDIWL